MSGEGLMSTHTTSCQRQRGFSLIEVVIALAVFAVLVAGFLTALERSATVSQTHNEIAEINESLRYTIAEMVRMIRMAGTGGLPLLAPGAGGGLNVLAVDVVDDVETGTLSFGSPPKAPIPGTDVLTLRGVIGGSLFDVQGTTAIQSTGATSYQVRIEDSSPFTGHQQGLIVPAVGTPILFTAAWELPVTLANGQTRYFSKYNIGLITSASIDTVDPLHPLVIDFKTQGATDAENMIIALNEDGTFQPFQEKYVITAGFLDDLVFFVGENDAKEPALFLYTRADDTVTELVANVASLQVALGCDIGPVDGELTEVGDSPDDDEWFYNVAGDTAPSALDVAALQEVRVSVVVRSATPDNGWKETAPMPENAPALTAIERSFRHRSLSVNVVIRSHPPATV
jgi:prepilin-type N-terminal cleavage/methylation domain-containing protein